ncbi:MAG: cell division protein FtsZ [Prevotella sp.]|nr:cell division protein FtsZ [Prevotella sp.]MCM1075054.1 cell division protein FtsZ [Ruminococcus sp.]
MADYNTISDPTSFIDDEYRIRPIIKVIGVGGGGGNAVNYLYSQGIENITFMVCNTDKQALKNNNVPKRIVMGDPSSPDFGLGAGDDPEVGRAAAEFSADDIAAALNDDTNMVFITAGMGGGTGTGAGPVVARIAREAGKLTVGIVTIPFFFEGEHKIYKALEGAEEMRKHVDTLLIINNERLTEIYKDLNLVNAFSKADDTLANATRSIADIIYTEGYINADFKDVRATLENSSTAIISTGYGEGDKRVTKAIKDALNSPLLRNSDIRTSKRLLFYLYCNPEAENVVSMSEMDEITQFSANLSKSIKIKWGACWDRSLGERVKMTILASGFDVTISGNNNNKNNKDTSIIFSADNNSDSRKEDNSRQDKEKKSAEDISSRIAAEYGKDKILTHNQEMARSKYVVLKPSQFDNDEVIALFDKIPAYNRDTNTATAMRMMGTPDQLQAERREAAKAAETPSVQEGNEPKEISFY